LQRLAGDFAEGRLEASEAQRELVDSLLHCRALSLDVVEAFEKWRLAGSRGGVVVEPQYLVAMKDDTRWLAESSLGELLNFSPKSDPFFVVPSSRDAVTASNPMTQTLQAKHPVPERRPKLPLQSSLLRRIRKAELLIMRESMEVRLQQTKKCPPQSGQVQVATSHPRPKEARRSSSEVLRPQDRQSPQVPAAVAEEEEEVAPPPRPKPVRPATVDTVFDVQPVNVPRDAAKALIEEYLQRVPAQIARGANGWPALAALMAEEGDEGPLGLEWFWLRRHATEPVDAASAEGLAVWREKRQASSYGQLVHFSVVDVSFFEEALQSVKSIMFACLPVSNIRLTLWHSPTEDGSLKGDPEIEAIAKKLYFKWFTLDNPRAGVRGQVVRRPRAEPPDDPPMPLQVPSIELCLGQVWLRGASSALKSSGACIGNLALAAACMRAFRGKDAAEAPAPEKQLTAASCAAWASCKTALQKALLTGTLDQVLAKLVPARLPELKGVPLGATGALDTASLMQSLNKTLEAGRELPGEVLCQAVADAPELVRRGLTQNALKEASEGLGLESLPDEIAKLQPKDGCFARVALTLEWPSVNILDENTFEVPVAATGRCPSHPHPLLYLCTSEDDVYVVIIPWHGAVPVRDQDIFLGCTDILRGAQPLEENPFATIRLYNLDVRRSVRQSPIENAAAFGMPSESLHAFEFSSLSVSSGRVMLGKLQKSSLEGELFIARRPFAVCLWQKEMDDLNIPLSVTMVP